MSLCVMMLHECTLLQLPYNGPYHVVKHADKHITLEVANRHEVVSLDHLKPAFMECNQGRDMNKLALAIPTAPPSSIPRIVTYSG